MPFGVSLRKKYPFPITTHTNLLRTMLCMVVALLTRSKMDLVAEPTAKWQPHTCAIRTVFENFDRNDFAVSFDLPFYGLEWHKGIIPLDVSVLQV